MGAPIAVQYPLDLRIYALSHSFKKHVFLCSPFLQTRLTHFSFPNSSPFCLTKSLDTMRCSLFLIWITSYLAFVAAQSTRAGLPGSNKILQASIVYYHQSEMVGPIREVLDITASGTDHGAQAVICALDWWPKYKQDGTEEWMVSTRRAQESLIPLLCR